jgi:hypothetical protein
VDYIAIHTRAFLFAAISILALMGALVLVFSRRLAKMNVERNGGKKTEAELEKMFSTYYFIGITVGLVLLGRSIWAMYRFLHGDPFLFG